LLIFARDHDHEAVYATTLLAQMGLANIELHPGYQLRVQTLGQFRVERGQQEVAAGDWKRAKARELFQLLLTFYGRSLHREQIIEMLWPGSEPEAALRDFKIAYSTLCSVLEPERQRNAASAFIYRDESHYGLRPEADIWVDVNAFRHWVELGDEAAGERAVSHYRKALSLFAGEYLPASPYAEWCRQEREQLHLLYLQMAEKLAALSLEQADYNTTIHLCQTILAQDNCWEPAYRLLMRASVCSGNRSQAIRAYEQCVRVLKTELDVEPDSETTAVYQQIVASSR
jgi:DNA-binding SARP family transcriptional activator